MGSYEDRPTPAGILSLRNKTKEKSLNRIDGCGANRNSPDFKPKLAQQIEAWKVASPRWVDIIAVTVLLLSGNERGCRHSYPNRILNICRIKRGESQPVSSNAAAQGRAQNRRMAVAIWANDKLKKVVDPHFQ